MSERIYHFNKSKFPFDELTLANPQGLQGGAYFSKLKILGTPVTLQTIRCKTKNGIIKTEKKMYCDLMFSKDDDEIIDFIVGLENTIKNLIYAKKDSWFHSDMDFDTIEYHWQQVLRTYKNTNVLLRCHIKKPRNRLTSAPIIQIYDEDESLLKLEDLTKDKTIMGLLELTGLKFTSQSFSLEFNLQQAMILKERVRNNRCLIQYNTDIKEEVLVDNDREDESEQSEHAEQELQEEDINTGETSPSIESEESLEITPIDLKSEPLGIIKHDNIKMEINEKHELNETEPPPEQLEKNPPTFSRK